MVHHLVSTHGTALSCLVMTSGRKMDRFICLASILLNCKYLWTVQYLTTLLSPTALAPSSSEVRQNKASKQNSGIRERSYSLDFVAPPSGSLWSWKSSPFFTHVTNF